LRVEVELKWECFNGYQYKQRQIMEKSKEFTWELPKWEKGKIVEGYVEPNDHNLIVGSLYEALEDEVWKEFRVQDDYNRTEVLRQVEGGSKIFRVKKAKKTPDLVQNDKAEKLVSMLSNESIVDKMKPFQLHTNLQQTVFSLTLHNFAKHYVVIQDKGVKRYFNEVELDYLREMEDMVEKGYHMKYVKLRKGSVAVWVKDKEE
jgi:hypothetical protein